jgi:fatty acid desaturase
MRNLIATALVLLALLWAARFLKFLLLLTIVAVVVVMIVRAARWWYESPERAERRAVDRELRRMRRYAGPMARIDRRMREIDSLIERR